jgi:hypothetical protein
VMKTQYNIFINKAIGLLFLEKKTYYG